MEKKTVSLEGIHYATGQPIRLEIRDGTIVSADVAGAQKEMPVIAPGLVDLQVNGFMGIDFNDPGLTPEQVELVSSRLLLHGVTGYFPTLITGPTERTARLLGVIAEAVRRTGLAGQMIKGIHLEGPFISKEDGPRGAHPLQYCMDPDMELLMGWQEASGGLIRIITLAPELPGSGAMIRKCREMGMVVGIGHTGANSEEIRKAAGAGATLSTHLGNGAHPVLPRHPNYIWDQLAEERLWASMIGDSFHLPDAVLKVFIRTKKEKAILVSDSMNFSGLPPGIYDSPATGKVRLTPRGKLHMEGDPGTLAGSASKLMDGIRRIAHLESFTCAWEMASIYPCRLLDDPASAGLQAGAPADLVLLSRDEPELKIVKVLKSGKEHQV